MIIEKKIIAVKAKVLSSFSSSSIAPVVNSI